MSSEGANPPKILYVDNSRTFGGAIISLAHLADDVSAIGFEPIVVSGQPRETLDRLYGEIQSYSIDLILPWLDEKATNGRRSPLLAPFEPVRRAGRSLSRFIRVDVAQARRLTRIGRSHKVDLVHTNNEPCSQLDGILAARFLGVPCVSHHRAMGHDFGRAARFSVGLATHHIAISQAVADSLQPFGIATGELSVIHNGVDIDKFYQRDTDEGLRSSLNISQGTPVIGHFGRVVPWKGQLQLVAALARIPKAVAFHAIIVGDASDGPADYIHQVKSAVRESDLESRVSFCGQRDDVPQLMSLCDIVVHSSIEAEPFGRVVIEAMASQKPTIAANLGGPIEIIRHNVDGILVDPQDAARLAESIVQLLQDPDLRKTMGASARVRAKDSFSRQSTARSVRDVYAKLLGK